jgi:hypothetical protein
MRFILLGYDQDAGIRMYAFQGLGEGTRTNFTVGVDLALIPGFGIHIQELPLLCRELLEREGEAEDSCALTLSEGEMRVYADVRAAAREAAKKKKPRRTAGEDTPAPVEGREHKEWI